MRILIQNEKKNYSPSSQNKEIKQKNERNEMIIIIFDNIMQYFNEKIQKTKKKIFKIIKNNSKMNIFFTNIFLNYKVSLKNILKNLCDNKIEDLSKQKNSEITQKNKSPKIKIAENKKLHCKFCENLYNKPKYQCMKCLQHFHGKCNKTNNKLNKIFCKTCLDLELK